MGHSFFMHLTLNVHFLKILRVYIFRIVHRWAQKRLQRSTERVHIN